MTRVTRRLTHCGRTRQRCNIPMKVHRTDLDNVRRWHGVSYVRES